MNWILAIWFALIGVEIFRNWSIIEVGKKRPTYWWSNLIRIVVGFIFWLLCPVVFEIGYYQWLGMIPMMLLTFWWCFDYGLTQFRNLVHRILKDGHELIAFYYLNPKGSWLDRMQCRYPHPYPWFWWKLFLMVGGLLLYYYGLNAAWLPYEMIFGQ